MFLINNYKKLLQEKQFEGFIQYKFLQYRSQNIEGFQIQKIFFIAFYPLQIYTIKHLFQLSKLTIIFESLDIYIINQDKL
ncbi:hypothetical protein pb186bvf_016290 [Paramecium bursaria]